MESLYLCGQKPCKSIGTKETVHIKPWSRYPDEIWKRSFSSPVRPTVRTNPSRKRRFSKTLVKWETFENGGLRKHFEKGVFRKRWQELSRDFLTRVFLKHKYKMTSDCCVWGGVDALGNRQCNPCHLQYRGETKRRLKDRFNEHRRSVDKNCTLNPNPLLLPNIFCLILIIAILTRNESH